MAEVRSELIELFGDLVMQVGVGHMSFHTCKQFGSRYPGDPTRLAVQDFLPDEQLRHVENLTEFAGMLVYGKWIFILNGRQAVFFFEAGIRAIGP